MTALRREILPRWDWPTRLNSLRGAFANVLRVLPVRTGERRLRSLVVQLGEHQQALAGLAADTEEKFLAMGTALQEQAGAGGRLVAEGKRLVDRAADGEASQDAIGAAVELVQHTLDFIDECVEQTRELVDRLDRYHERTGRLLKEEERVERILAPLRTVQTMFRIESVVLPAEMQAGFNALSGEIPKFETEVRQTFDQHAETLMRIRQGIETTTEHLRARVAGQRDMAALERARITQALGGLEREIAHGRERNTRLNELLAGVDHEVRSLVVSLQYQDITRQKVEHVGSALDEIRLRLAPGRRADLATALVEVRESSRLEALQVEAVRQELGKALSGIATGVGRIEGVLAQIETECWPRTEFAVVGTAVTGRVAGLQAILHAVHELMPAALASADEAMRVIDTFSHVAANVATTAREMAESMRLIALNAQVLAAQAGHQGAGLLILAERTYGISEDIRRVTDSISAEFKEADGQLGAVIKQCESLKCHAQQRNQEFDQRGKAVAGSLLAYRDETVQVLESLGLLLEQISAQSGEMRRATEGRSHYDEVLASLGAHLGTIARVCDDALRFRRRSNRTGAQLAGLESRYTMASERQVHAAAVASAGASLSALLPTAACDYEPIAAAPEQPTVLGAADEMKAGSPATPVGAASPSYGDNVELF